MASFASRARRVADAPLSTQSGSPVLGAPPEPELDVHDIQGNGLGGFNKDYQCFLFLRILDAKAARTWLARVVPRISTLAEIVAFNRLFRSLRVRQGIDPPGVSATWLNIAFSYRGIAQFTSEELAQQLQDPSFQAGLFNISTSLGDPENRASWKFGGSEDTDAHIMLMIASDDPAHLTFAADRADSEIKEAVSSSGSPGLEVIWRQPSATLPGDLRGHEHFGFKDGISQPAPRGRVSSGALDFLVPRWLDPSDPDALLFAEPGRALVWPGQFVIGWQRQNLNDPVEPGTIDSDSPNWAKNGSYVVFRRLQQKVDAFHTFLKQEAQRLSKIAGFDNISGGRLGSMLVGRWPSGAPIMRVPDHDDLALGRDDLASNNFKYAADTRTPKLIPIDGPDDSFPQATADFEGRRCPLAGHIRKVNPRDQDTDLRSPIETLSKLILRRGIPYGSTTDADRGLCFVSYQSSIISQFEFLTKTWVDDSDRPRPAGGLDLVIGQRADSDRARTAFLRSSTGNSDSEPLVALADFVVPTGGGYFFAPSIRTLQDWSSR